MTEFETAKSDRVIREEILRLTLMGLEEDLDDLRDELSRQLESYEGRLKKTSSSLPKWLDLEPGRILEAFAVSRDGFPDSRLGPRLVAVCAARAEAFIHEWVGREGTISSEHELEGRPWANDLEDVRRALEDAESAARDVALNADAELTGLLDLILAELDEKREEDASAMRQLVGAGDVERGERARKEIADLWEEQRKRAAELRLVWDTLENLVFEGVDLSIEGLSELDELLNRAEEGLEGADSEATVDDASSDTIPAPMYTKSEGDSKLGHAIDDASRQTEPLAVQEDVGHTNPYLRRPRRSLEDHEKETLEIDRPGGDESTLGESTEAPKSEEPLQDEGEVSELSAGSSSEEPEVSESADEYSGETVESVEDDDAPEPPDVDANDHEERQAAEAAETQEEEDESEEVVESSEAEESLEDVVDEPRVDDEPSDSGVDDAQGATEKTEVDPSEPPPEEEPDAESDSTGPPDSEQSSGPEQADDEGDAARHEKPVVGEAFRVVSRWVPVEPLEFALGFGIPIGLLVLLAIPGLAELIPDVQPIVELSGVWFWVFPWLFIGCVAWSLIFIILRNWRPMWRGWMMHLVRWSEHREEVEVVVDDRGVRFGSVRHAWSQLRAVERRWESKPDGTFGWLVRFETRAGQTAVAAADRNFSQWREAEVEVEPVPDDVWQVNPNLLSLLRSRLP